MKKRFKSRRENKRRIESANVNAIGEQSIDLDQQSPVRTIAATEDRSQRLRAAAAALLAALVLSRAGSGV
ncbi:MAG TPA: hypothetical protein VFY29_16285 [Terriglobia bacterium]|nr:hypothetical protein [Terriglobia bacterium]